MQSSFKNCGSRVPGKLILGGEHAVVAGRPALLVAVRRYVTAQVSRTGDGLIACTSKPCFSLSRQDLACVVGHLEERHAAFLAGHLPVEAILETPACFVQYAAALAGATGLLNPDEGLHLALHSDLPAGAGMGSSAAVALSVLDAVGGLAGPGLSRDTLFSLGCRVEKLQHGNPSGADVFTSLHGGCIRFVRGAPPGRVALKAPPLWTISTGPPESTTGACVSAVQQAFPPDHALWDSFEAALETLQLAAEQGEADRWLEAVRTHHRLLVRIGVVPPRVRQFVERVEAAGGAAKICGAGSVSGEQAGTVLALSDPEALHYLCGDYGYGIASLEVEDHGVQRV